MKLSVSLDLWNPKDRGLKKINISIPWSIDIFGYRSPVSSLVFDYPSMVLEYRYFAVKT